VRHSGAGQRWDLVASDVLRKHDLAQLQSGDAPLVQTFQPPGARPVSVNLTFLSARPKLGRILANTFWLTYQAGPRRKTVLAVAWVLKIFYVFLDHRAESMPNRIRRLAGRMPPVATKNRRHGVFELRLFSA
jgi:hypothetical protein